MSRLSVSLMALVIPVCMEAQEPESKLDWYLGVGEGVHINMVNFSDIDKNIFPDKKNQYSAVFSAFVQAEFGKERQFGIRSDISYLRRGGKLTNINRAKSLQGVEDFYYSIKADYLDLRIPLIYNFNKATSVFRPYVFVAPVIGLPIGGDVSLQEDYADGTYEGFKTELSNANISKLYIAGQIGAGVKTSFSVGSKGQNKFYIGLEASYEYGFTDTYSSKEKDGNVKNVVTIGGVNRLKPHGNRKFSGIEARVLLSVPFSAFKKAKSGYVIPQSYTTPKPVYIEAEEEKPCYTLEEIEDMMARNENVRGKVICAVDAILFDFGKSNIQPISYTYLNQLAKTINRTNARIEVKGHTDNVGTDEFNMKLSEERAKAVVKYLVKNGVHADKVSYSYYGATRPLSDNETDEGRTMNRRVEFEILK